MTPWLLIVLAGVIAVVWLLSRVLLPDTSLPYDKRPSLLTQAELKFFHSLRDAVEDDWSIQAMVRMADLISVKAKSTQNRAWWNRILAKHIDFLLCDQDSLEVRLAVELDDASHRRADRVERDKFVDEALAAAGLPLLRVPVQDAYDPDELRDLIDELV